MKPSRPVLVVASVDIGRPSAPAVHLLSIARGLAVRNCDVVLLAPPASGPPVIDVSASGVHVVNLGRRRLRSLPNSARLVLLVPQLLRLLRDGRRVIYSRFALTSFLVLAVGRLFRCTLISEHNGWLTDELKVLGGPALVRPAARVTQRLDASLAHRVRVVVPGLVGRLTDAGISADKIFVAGNGTDLARVHPLPRAQAVAATGLREEGRYIGFLGELAPWQGVDLALQALPAVLRQHPDVCLVIGGDGPQRGPLQTLANSLGVAANVRFMGMIPPDDVGSFLSCLDVAVAPKTSLISDIGFSPLKVRDYAAAGCASVLPDLPGLRELVSGGWVELHRPHDPNDLATALCALLAAPERLVQMRTAARRYAEAHFGWDIPAEEILRQISATAPHSGTPHRRGGADAV